MDQHIQSYTNHPTNQKNETTNQTCRIAARARASSSFQWWCPFGRAPMATGCGGVSSGGGGNGGGDDARPSFCVSLRQTHHKCITHLWCFYFRSMRVARGCDVGGRMGCIVRVRVRVRVRLNCTDSRVSGPPCAPGAGVHGASGGRLSVPLWCVCACTHTHTHAV